MRQQKAKANDTLGKNSYTENRLDALKTKNFQNHMENLNTSPEANMRPKRITRAPAKLDDSPERKGGKEEKIEETAEELGERIGEGEFEGFPTSDRYLWQTYAPNRGLANPPPMPFAGSLTLTPA